MVANPANTNALILKENAPSIPAENITCLTRLDHNRALGQVGLLVAPASCLDVIVSWAMMSSSGASYCLPATDCHLPWAMMASLHALATDLSWLKDVSSVVFS